MTEYWKSTPKYYCKTCNTWIADNRVSRDTHEKSVKHKQKVQDALKLRREQKLQGARSEEELKRELRDIEQAARAKLAADRATSGGLFYQNVPVESMPLGPGGSRGYGEYAMPAPGYDAAASAAGGGGEERARRPFRANEEHAPELEPPSEGKYTIRGQTYLEGQAHEDKLVIGTPCEIWIEELEEWMPAHIVGRTEVPVPNTDIVILRFKVTYQKERPEEDEDGAQAKDESDDSANDVTVENVKSDQLRLKCDKSGNWDPHTVDLKGRIAPEVDLITGLGAWQTVSVQLVDEEKERLEAARREQEEAEAAAERARHQRARTAKELAAMDANDALSSYDPYGTGVYKGVKVEATVVDESYLPESTGEQVGFKKRSNQAGGGGGAAAAKKRLRKKTADDADDEER